MAKLWRKYGNAAALNHRAINGSKPAAKKLEQLLSAKASAAFRINPGVAAPVAKVVGLDYAHEYLRNPSSSEAAVQNRARKAALAGRILTGKEHRIQADARQLFRRRDDRASYINFHMSLEAA